MDFLNLDTSYPVADSHHATNTAGIIRFFGPGDALTKDTINRVEGDIVHRFNLHQSKINELVQAVLANPAFTNEMYVLVDGSKALSGPLESPAPTADGHLANKQYVDDAIDTVNGSLTVLSEGFATHQEVATVAWKSSWVSHTWVNGTRQKLSFAFPLDIAKDAIVGIKILGRFNLDLDDANAVVYRDLTVRTSGGPVVDDIWVEGSHVHAVIPNLTVYSSYPSATGYGTIQTFEAVSFRAVLLYTGSSS